MMNSRITTGLDKTKDTTMACGWFCIVLMAIAFNARGALGQALVPKEYQAVNPPSKNMEIYTSALLERLLGVDDQQYQFSAITFFYFSWIDKSARQKMEESTLAYRNGTSDCQMPCVSGSKPSRSATGFAGAFSCCDGIWLPEMVVYNLLPPYHTQFDGMVVSMDGTVGWYKSLYGKFFTQMEFEKFPLDTQRLQISLGMNSLNHGANHGKGQGIKFVPSASSTAFLMRQGVPDSGEKKVDSVSGWEITNVSMEAVDVLVMDTIEYFIYTFGAAPVKSEVMPIIIRNQSNGNPFANPHLRHYGVDVYIDIARLSSYYIINQVVPIYVLVLVSLVTYVYHPSKIETRIAVNLTCFLALTAIKWVVNGKLPNSSYPTTVSMIIVTAYAMFGFAILESIVVHAVHKKAKMEEEAEEEKKESEENKDMDMFSSSPGPKTIEKSPSAKRWHSFSKGIRKVKGDHDHAVTELAIIIDIFSLSSAVITIVVSSSLYFTY